MEPYIEHDPINKRTVAMFDEFGIRYRVNTIEPGGQIELHVHSFDHTAAVHGDFEVTTTSPQGEKETRMARHLEHVPAGWQHGFRNIGNDTGTVACFWRIE